MKKIHVFITLIVSCYAINAQYDTSRFPYKSKITVSPKYLNGYDVHSESFASYILDKINHNKNKINTDATYPKVYFTNRNKKEYLEIYSGPDIGWGQFYCIGYTLDSSCDYCGNYLGDIKFNNFIIDSSIHLGDEIGSIGLKLKLPFFRRFSYQGITYFYYEGPYSVYYPYEVPRWIVYYKFRNDKLIEIGFGHGFTGINPMLQEKNN